MTKKYDYKGVVFIEPNTTKNCLYAHSNDYVVVMHLDETIKSLFLKNKLTYAAIK